MKQNAKSPGIKRLVHRRQAIQYAAATGIGFAIPSLAAGDLVDRSKPIQLGLIADVHIGLSPKAEDRLEAFLMRMKNQATDALIQLGDFAFPNAKHQSSPDAFNAAHKTTLHTIGNHDLDFGLTKKQCQKAWGMPDRFYRFDLGGIRILVLDGNDKGSPSHRGGYPIYIGKIQQEWLGKELKTSDRPLLIASHQPLAGPSAVDNSEDIQKLLGRFKEKILLCINGHTHIDRLVESQGVRFLHINSASYYWMGGKVRMAHYTDPLFTTLSIDPKEKRIVVQGKKSSWDGKSPEEHGYFKGERDRDDLRQSVTPQIRSRIIKIS